MSIHVDDLRSVGGYLGDLAADEIEQLEQEVADSNKAYELLFASHSKLRDSHEELVKVLRDLLDACNEQMPDAEAGQEAQNMWADRRAAARNNADFLLSKVAK